MLQQLPAVEEHADYNSLKNELLPRCGSSAHALYQLWGVLNRGGCPACRSCVYLTAVQHSR